MSIELKPLSIQDYPIYLDYYKKANYEGYQTNFHSLFLWNEAYQTKFYYNEHFLITLCHYDDFDFWNMPLTTHEHFKEAMECMLEYCENHKMPFLMDAILEEEEQLIHQLYPNKFIFKHTDNSKSYIYEAHMHRSLSGKKMQKRRNHYNAFLKMYQHRFTYRSCNKEDKDAIAQLMDVWASHKDSHRAIEFEKHGVLNVLDHLDELNYKMACIEIDGNIEAIILGSRINHNTVQIHVEKANTNIRGLYVAIFKYFLENEFSDVLWVNREEDMGIESLRKAKMQLHPIKLLEQSFAYIDNAQIRKANPQDYPLLKERWLKIFKEDTEAFLTTYFNRANLEIYLLENDYQLVSTVYLRKLNISVNHQNQIAYFIEGVSTHHLYEGRGYMKQLLQYALNQHLDDIYFLQAYHWEVYDSFDFPYEIYKSITTLTQPFPLSKNYDIHEGFNKEIISSLYREFTSSYDGFVERETPIDAEGYQWIYHDSGYVAYATFNGKIVVTEMIYKSKEDAYPLLNKLLEKYQTIQVISEKDLFTGEKLLFIKSNKSLPHFYFNEYI